jgi:hypothetical protein
MTFRETIQLDWKQFSGKQKITIAAVSLVLMISLFFAAINSFRAWSEYSALEADAKKSKKEADEALLKAAQIAQMILEREIELQKTEEKRDEKQLEVNAANEETLNALDNVNRARSQPRTDKPSARKLCAELAELGYPCR